MELTAANDGRKRDRRVQEFQRKEAVRRVKSGEPVAVVMRELKLQRTTFYKWSRKLKASGGKLKVLDRRTPPGPATLLNEEQKRQVRRWVVGKDPRQYGFDFGLWTRALVGALIEKRLGIRLGLTAVGRLLAQLDLTPQKPLARAYERDPKAIAHWKAHRYPALAQEAKKQGAELLFLDESGFRADEPLGRTWGVRGKTPKVKVSGSRRRVSVLGAVTLRGAFWYRTFGGKFNAERFIGFLKALRRGRRRPIFLVLDRHPVHVARAVEKYVQSTQGALRFEFLPGYAPELNPAEEVWRYAKRTGTARTPLKKEEVFHERVEKQMDEIKAKPRLVRSFFRGTEAEYVLLAA